MLRIAVPGYRAIGSCDTFISARRPTTRLGQSLEKVKGGCPRPQLRPLTSDERLTRDAIVSMAQQIQRGRYGSVEQNEPARYGPDTALALAAKAYLGGKVERADDLNRMVLAIHDPATSEIPVELKEDLVRVAAVQLEAYARRKLAPVRKVASVAERASLALENNMALEGAVVGRTGNRSDLDEPDDVPGVATADMGAQVFTNSASATVTSGSETSATANSNVRVGAKGPPFVDAPRCVRAASCAARIASSANPANMRTAKKSRAAWRAPQKLCDASRRTLRGLKKLGGLGADAARELMYGGGHGHWSPSEPAETVSDRVVAGLGWFEKREEASRNGGR